MGEKGKDIDLDIRLSLSPPPPVHCKGTKEARQKSHECAGFVKQGVALIGSAGRGEKSASDL